MFYFVLANKGFSIALINDKKKEPLCSNGSLHMSIWRMLFCILGFQFFNNHHLMLLPAVPE